MRKRKLFSLIMFAILSMVTNNLAAQGSTITGTVLSDEGTPLVGVTVTVSGTKRATVTDNNGKFTITANSGATLEFSYLGYSTQKLKATAAMEVRLEKGEKVEKKVVVTALGIKKERKALGYSVTDLNAQ